MEGLRLTSVAAPAPLSRRMEIEAAWRKGCKSTTVFGCAPPASASARTPTPAPAHPAPRFTDRLRSGSVTQQRRHLHLFRHGWGGKHISLAVMRDGLHHGKIRQVLAFPSSVIATLPGPQPSGGLTDEEMIDAAGERRLQNDRGAGGEAQRRQALARGLEVGCLAFDLFQNQN